MGRPSKDLQDFMQKHKISDEEVWEVRVGGAWAVKHSALERVAAEQNIRFDRPAIIESRTADKVAVVCVFAKMGDREEWSFGEASPSNNKNAYVYSMAEKRGKDRCILKLLNAHGALYSESEADEFSEPGTSGKRENPHVTRATDIMPAVEYDQHGEPIDNIPLADESVKPLSKKDAREIFSKLQTELHAHGDLKELMAWGERSKNRVGVLPSDWQDTFRGMFIEHRDAIREQDAQDNRRMAS